MYIKFKYRLPASISALATKEIVDFYDDIVTGWIDNGDVHQLSHCALYMVCEFEDYDGTNVICNPVVIVAGNENRAMDIYSEVTNGKNGMILCSILDNCKDVKVIPDS
jgi:hypothetical protein